MDTLHLAMSQPSRAGPHSQQENVMMACKQGSAAKSQRSLKLSQKGNDVLPGSNSINSAKKLGLGGFASSLGTPFNARRKLGNVSNTPGMSSNHKQAKPAALKEEVFVKPLNYADTPRPSIKKKQQELKKTPSQQSLSQQQSQQFKTPVAPSLQSQSAVPPPPQRLPTLYEDRENCFPLSPRDFALESHPYATVGMFERDLTSLPFDILEEEEEEAEVDDLLALLEDKENNRPASEMTIDDWLEIL